MPRKSTKPHEDSFAAKAEKFMNASIKLQNPRAVRYKWRERQMNALEHMLFHWTVLPENETIKPALQRAKQCTNGWGRQTRNDGEAVGRELMAYAKLHGLTQDSLEYWRKHRS